MIIFIFNRLIKKNLGIIFHQNLTWTITFHYLKIRLVKNWCHQQIRKNFPLYTLKILYYALINRYFDNYNIGWGIERHVHFENLFQLQKKVVRVITWSKWNSHSTLIFRQLNILNLFYINIVQATCFVYRSLAGQLPPMLFCSKLYIS